MKLRRTIDDFRVDEESTLPIGAAGDFAVYRLIKRGWTTLDALDRLAREVHVSRGRCQHAGLKDRHAVTSQLVTMSGGPRRAVELENIRLEYLGQSPRAIRNDDIRCNSFQIVVRSLAAEDAAAMMKRTEAVSRCGVPNYFDDQRFGSWLPEHGFIAEAWIREDYERAIRMLFAEPSPHDDAGERVQKEILRTHWGEWKVCKQLLAKSHRRSIITFLDDRPGDFKGAWARVNADLRGLTLSALQSHLWNQIAAAAIRGQVPSGKLNSITLKTGSLPVFEGLEKETFATLREMRIPLPSGRITMPEEPLARYYQQGLSACGWALEELKVRHPRDRFFSRALRDLLLVPGELRAVSGDDELEAGKKKVALSFTLPRGAYATMIVKRLTLAEAFDVAEDE